MSPLTKTEKKEGAKERRETHKTLTPQEKIDKLDEKLGTGVGAKKEREKLKLSIVGVKPKKKEDKKGGKEEEEEAPKKGTTKRGKRSNNA